MVDLAQQMRDLYDEIAHLLIIPNAYHINTRKYSVDKLLCGFWARLSYDKTH